MYPVRSEGNTETMADYINYRLLTILLIPAMMLVATGAKTLGPPEKAPWEDTENPPPCQVLTGDITGILGGNETKVYTVDLPAGTFTIAGWGSWDLVSLRLTVRDSNGEELACDEGRNNLPVCEISLEEGGSVKIELEAGISRVGDLGGAYSLAVMSGTGCVEAEDDRYAKEILDEWTMITFTENSLVRDWDVQHISGARIYGYEYELPAGKYFAVAETTQPGDDIDMYVKLESDEVIRGNELPNNFPICYFELEHARVVTIEIDPFSYAEGSSTELVFLLAEEIRTEE